MKKCLSVLLILTLLWSAMVTAIADEIEFEGDSVDIVALEVEPEQTDGILEADALAIEDDVSGDMDIELIDGLDASDVLVSPEVADAQDEAPVANRIASNAIEWNGHYYRLFECPDIRSWEEAKAYCESLGGYLATITSAEEDAFIYNNVVDAIGYTSAYFGLSDTEESGVWRWVTGEETSYLNWADGEPSSMREHYGMYYFKFQDGKWGDGDFRTDTPQNGGKAFICEWSEYAGQDRGTEFVVVDGVLETYVGHDDVVKIPDGVKAIGNLAFVWNKYVKEVIVPEGVQEIDENAFMHCESLSRVSLPNSLTRIGYQAFAVTGITSVELPNSVTSLGNEAFADCNSLSNVKMSDSMISVPYRGFANCKNLTNAVLPNKVMYINESAFQNTNLNEVTLPNTVTSIGSSAYADCSNLKKVVIPASVTEISSDAFQNSHPTVYCEPGSFAETYATRSNLPTRDIAEATGTAPEGIAITKGKSATVYVGNKMTLKVKLTPAGARAKLTWTSSNKKVATVSSKGVVTPKKAGKAVITVKTSNGKSTKITIKVVDAKSIKLKEGKSATLKVGKQLTLHVKANPSKVKPAVKWTSSNKKVATVSGKGVVKALKPGKVTITAKIANGKTASITITVKK